MAFGNNRSGKQPRAHFQLAGGTTIRFKHPYLAGQLGTGSDVIDEIDISSCCKLDDTYFEAMPNQDSAKQVVLVDSSVVTICNRLLNGTITMPVIKTTGTVATGDFISALQLIKSVGDTVGGFLYKTDKINGKAITKLYYGVTVKMVPDDRAMGNDVAVFNVQLYYAGWIEAISATGNDNLKKIWAVGSSNGITGFYSPYSGQNAEGNSGTVESTMSSGLMGITDDAVNDDTTGAANTESYAKNVVMANTTLVDTGTPTTTTGEGANANKATASTIVTIQSQLPVTNATGGTNPAPSTSNP